MKKTMLSYIIMGLISTSAMAEMPPIPNNEYNQNIPQDQITHTSQNQNLQDAQNQMRFRQGNSVPTFNQGMNHQPPYNPQQIMRQPTMPTAPVEKTIPAGPKLSKDETFKRCILKSNKMLNNMDYLKSIPESERAVTLYKSQLWETASEPFKEDLLKFIASLSETNELKYKIIKGKMADDFKQECLLLIKN